MKRQRLSIKLISLVGTMITGIWAACAAPVAADEPLRPPYDYTRQVGPHVVTADGTRQSITIRADEGPTWTVQAWSDFFYLSEDGRAILLTPGAQLTGFDAAPDLIVGSLYSAGPPASVTHIRLGQLYPDPGVLPTSASHRIWHEGIEITEAGWLLRRAGLPPVLITYPATQ